MNTLDLDFNGEKIVIELLDSPAAKQWIDAYQQYKKYFRKNRLDQDFKPSSGCIFPSADGYWDKGEDFVDPVKNIDQQGCVDEINSAIADANECLIGKEFPYQAFLGMGWDTTNLIHRCFTIGRTTLTNWQHTLHKNTLAQLKKDSYFSKNISLSSMLTPQYELKQGKVEEFVEAVERINKYIHFYEGFHRSKRAWDICVHNKSFTNNYLQLEWDSYDRKTGSHNFFFSNRINEAELKESLPDDYYEYDVFLGKSIAGKDYEFCYADYDNPLEYDITNLDNINGSLKLFFEDSFKLAYKDSKFTDWCEGYGIERHMFLPIPVGKIIENSLPINDTHIDNDYTQTWSDHSPKLKYPLNSCKSTLNIDMSGII